ncbi:MAG: PD-(D/E)XK nuclease family protein [Myxococcota bacterium]
MPLVGQSEESSDFRAQHDALIAKPAFDQLVISGRVDLSELELSYLFKLASLGVKLKFELPVDESGQGFSLPTTALAARIEKHHNLENIEIVFKPFSKPPRWMRYEAPDLVQEARLVAQVASGYGADKRIAVSMRMLDRRALIFQDALKDQGLDLTVMALPDLLGKEFDLVIIADAAHGRLTLSREPDWPLSDADCFLVNRLMGRQVLRRFEEDPLEPSLFPARQALEPMWFLGACDAATETLLVTSSLVDEVYQAQAASELTKLSWLGEPSSLDLVNKPLGKLERLIETASHAKSSAKQGAFQMDTARFREKFGDKLGLSRERAFSATRIEAFAKCPFRAFIERLLEVDLNKPSGSDIDPRILGQLAHKILEGGDLALFKAEADLVLAEHPEIHKGVWDAMMLWLHEALVRLESNLRKNPPIPGAYQVASEKKLGPMVFPIAGTEIFLGGVADRIDKSPSADIVVDYKLSSLSSLRMRFAQSEVLKTHFQIPIYLKLLGSQRSLIGYPISIKDGAPGPMIDMTERLDELDQALMEVLTPVLQGYVPPGGPESCGDCRLKALCRQ